MITGITNNFRTCLLILVAILFVGSNDLIVFIDDDEGLGDQVNDILAMLCFEFFMNHNN